MDTETPGDTQRGTPPPNGQAYISQSRAPFTEHRCAPHREVTAQVTQGSCSKKLSIHLRRNSPPRVPGKDKRKEVLCVPTWLDLPVSVSVCCSEERVRPKDRNKSGSAAGTFLSSLHFPQL